jgi:hypothetical protein
MLARGFGCIAVMVSACSTSAGAGALPSPDRTHAYVALIHSYYARYQSAKGDPYDFCVVGTDAPRCVERGSLMIGVWQGFLNDLDSTPAPSRFASDDAAFRAQLPKAISDLQRMIAAAKAGDHYPMVDAAGNYVSAMIPIVTDALHDVDPIWPIEH